MSLPTWNRTVCNAGASTFRTLSTKSHCHFYLDVRYSTGNYILLWVGQYFLVRLLHFVIILYITIKLCSNFDMMSGWRRMIVSFVTMASDAKQVQKIFLALQSLSNLQNGMKDNCKSSYTHGMKWYISFWVFLMLLDHVLYANHFFGLCLFSPDTFWNTVQTWHCMAGSGAT